MTSVGSKYKSQKVTHTFSLDNKDCCEIEISEREQIGNVYQFSLRISSHKGMYKKPIHFTAKSKGESSLKAINSVLDYIKETNLPYKNIAVYFNNDYSVRVFNELGSWLASGKASRSPNFFEIARMKELMGVVGFRYYINVKKEKILKVYGKPFHGDL